MCSTTCICNLLIYSPLNLLNYGQLNKSNDKIKLFQIQLQRPRSTSQQQKTLTDLDLMLLKERECFKKIQWQKYTQQNIKFAILQLQAMAGGSFICL